MNHCPHAITLSCADSWEGVVIPKKQSPQQPNFDDCGYYAGYVGAQITARALHLSDAPLHMDGQQLAAARYMTQAFLATKAVPAGSTAHSSGQQKVNVGTWNKEGVCEIDLND
jgi:hypothetical protein